MPPVSVKPESVAVENLYFHPLLAAPLRRCLERAPHGKRLPPTVRTFALAVSRALEGGSAFEASVRYEIPRCSVFIARWPLSRVAQTSHCCNLTPASAAAPSNARCRPLQAEVRGLDRVHDSFTSSDCGTPLRYLDTNSSASIAAPEMFFLNASEVTNVEYSASVGKFIADSSTPFPSGSR